MGNYIHNIVYTNAAKDITKATTGTVRMCYYILEFVPKYMLMSRVYTYVRLIGMIQVAYQIQLWLLKPFSLNLRRIGIRGDFITQKSTRAKRCDNTTGDSRPALRPTGTNYSQTTR